MSNPTQKFTLKALEEARSPESSGEPRPFLYAKQHTVNEPLKLVWGTVPEDLGGHGFFVSQNGAPDGTYPIHEYLPGSQVTNPSFGAPVMAGNGYIIRLDFDEPGKPKVLARMLKAPAYFADEATPYQGTLAPSGNGEGLAFPDEAELLGNVQYLIDSGLAHELVTDQEVHQGQGAAHREALSHPGLLQHLKAKAEGIEHKLEAGAKAALDKHLAGLLESVMRADPAWKKPLQLLRESWDLLLNVFLSFNYSGIPRYSLLLGFSEQLATALTPVNFSGNAEGLNVLATADIGRHWYLNPKTLAVASPSAPIKDYATGDMGMPWVFPIIMNTAHPVWDPENKVFYSFNFTQAPHRSSSAYWSPLFYLLAMKDDDTLTAMQGFLEDHMKPLLANIDLDNPEQEMPKLWHHAADIQKGFGGALEKLASSNHEALDPLGNVLKSLLIERQHERAADSGGGHGGKAKDECFISINTAPDLENWNKVKLLDEQGKPVQIAQAAHQMGVTQDYVFVIDAAFKTTMDVTLSFDFFMNFDDIWKVVEALLQKVFGRPISKALLLRVLRVLMTSPQDAFTNVYVARKADLANPQTVDGEQVVTVKTYTTRPEYVHALAEYDNPSNVITFYSLDNAALCLAEWLRWYDDLQVSPNATTPLSRGLIGEINGSPMDVGRLCKIQLNLDTQEVVVLKDELYNASASTYNDDQSQTKPSTWAIGLYGYKGYLNTQVADPTIDNLYVISNRPDAQWLTKFIYNLYTYYPNRVVPTEQILKLAQDNLSLSLLRWQTGNMQVEDHFVFPEEYYLYSTLFMPKTGPAPDGVPDSMHGYLLCIMENQAPGQDGVAPPERLYYREFWLFDAANLKQGPVCVMASPSLYFCFAVHSLYMPHLEGEVPPYTMDDMREDYDYLIKQNKKTYRKLVNTKTKGAVRIGLNLLLHEYFKWLNKFMETKVYTPFQEYRDQAL